MSVHIHPPGLPVRLTDCVCGAAIVLTWVKVDDLQAQLQHGDNPEARRDFPMVEYDPVAPRRWSLDIARWLDDLHEYAGARPSVSMAMAITWQDEFE